MEQRIRITTKKNVGDIFNGMSVHLIEREFFFVSNDVNASIIHSWKSHTVLSLYINIMYTGGESERARKIQM